MKTQAIRGLYPQFTPEERVQLFLAATIRGDAVEIARLGWSCSPETVSEYTDLLDRMWHVGMLVLSQWLDVSHWVVRARFAREVANRQLSVDEGLKGLARLVPQVGTATSAKKLKSVIREDRALLVRAEARWKQLSAAWKGTEAAIRRFCTERGLTTVQLFAMVKSLPPVIDEARADLAADVPADPQMDAMVYQALCDIVAGRLTAATG